MEVMLESRYCSLCILENRMKKPAWLVIEITSDTTGRVDETEDTLKKKKNPQHNKIRKIARHR